MKDIDVAYGEMKGGKAEFVCFDCCEYTAKWMLKQ